MKKNHKAAALIISFAIIMLTFVALYAVPFTAASKGPVSYYGQLDVSQNRIVGSKTGSPAQVKGMSFFWSNWCNYWNASTVDRMADEFKCEIVRASYGVDDTGAPYSSGDEAKVREVVNAAIKNDIFVIIDWHSHGAHSNAQAAKDFFSRMAQEYGSYDNVIFEVYNEPTMIAWSTVKGYAEQVIPVIRQHSDNLIIVGTPTWSQDVDAAANDPINAKNIAYALHFYAGTHFQALRDKANYAMGKGVALFVTEWGSVNSDGDGGINQGSTQEWLSWMDSNKLSWCNWAINDKAEGSSIFNLGGSLTATGNYMKDILTKNAATAEWRNAPEETTIVTDPPVEETSTTPPVNKEYYSVPGKVEAENYASMDGIELEECGEGGKNIGYLDQGDWLTYNINVAAAGEYTINFRVAAEESGGSLTVNNTRVDIPSTGSWQTWKDVSCTLKLDAGKQTLKLNITGSGFNINYMEFTGKDIPVVMDVDIDGDGVADWMDAALLKDHIHDGQPLMQNMIDAADLNDDRIVNVVDLCIVYRNI